MSEDRFQKSDAPLPRRRWLIGLEPILEGGRHGKHSSDWDVEDELIAVALLGDVTIDLTGARSIPEEVTIEAYAIIRDVDVVVPPRTHVALSGGVIRGDLVNEVPAVSPSQRQRTVQVRGHSMLGDVTVRLAEEARK